ncbi:uncharacterized protein F5147DRAFT_816196 [Suillus discolor]|uniref:Uncharacterized protein n=1 Tax=Suillus discolor TaxID=1912936 RepID=A0A9P7EYB9_9AGAM|nr:uncharacterized protein F5147DRAFT_816196 [Suillus discolor]KAG2097938.1 hypothetical protein F5147DRAFT_816196 [Suillus discolor]
MLCLAIAYYGPTKLGFCRIVPHPCRTLHNKCLICVYNMSTSSIKVLDMSYDEEIPYIKRGLLILRQLWLQMCRLNHLSTPSNRTRFIDISGSSLPLTSQHCDEIDRIVLEKTDLEDERANATITDPRLVWIMLQIILATSRLLKREHLKGSLDTEVASTKKTLHKHPQLREIIRHACQTRSFTRIADLKTQNYSKYPNLVIPCGRLKSHLRCSAKEWTLRHWYRTSAVQCCHLQPLVNKMIPIYFDDPALGSGDLNRISQMFISEKAGKNYHEQDLKLVTRTHDSIQCLSNLPYIALLLDLNVKPKLNVTFAEKEPNHAKTDRCLRIYPVGINKTTFPFLSQHP